MFTNSVPNFSGWSTETAIFVESPFKIVVSAYFEKGKKGQKCERVGSKIWPSQGWAKNLSKYVAQRNWTVFDSKNGSCLSSFLFCFLQKEDFWKTKKEKQRKIWTDLWLKKRQNLDRFLTLHYRVCVYIYIHVYIYAVELKTGPRFGVSSVKDWSKSSVKNWSNFCFAVFPQFYSFFWHF